MRFGSHLAGVSRAMSRRPTTSGVALLVVAGLQVVMAYFAMRPCSARCAIVGLVLGCAIGALAAIGGVRSLQRPPPIRRLRRTVLSLAVLASWGLILVYITRSWRVPRAPTWALVVGGFFPTGAWLTFIVAPFVAGICILFYSYGTRGRAESSPGGRS